jgi:uncharacterized protein
MVENNMYKTALITGASRGLGKQYAIQLAKRNYSLVLVARNEQRLQSLQQELSTVTTGDVKYIVADLVVEDDLNRLESMIAEEKIDLLVNAAGFGTAGLFAHNDIEKSMRLIKLQVEAITRLCFACLSGMLERNYGDIINVGSTIAYMTQRYNVVYAATKLYLSGFGAALNRELLGKDVHVQTLLPGLTRTEFYDTEELAPAKLSLKIPNKFWMLPEQVVHTSLKAMNHHKKFVVPGIRNKLFILFYQWADYFRMWLPGKRKQQLRF